MADSRVKPEPLDANADQVNVLAMSDKKEQPPRRESTSREVTIRFPNPEQQNPQPPPVPAVPGGQLTFNQMKRMKKSNLLAYSNGLRAQVIELRQQIQQQNQQHNQQIERQNQEIERQNQQIAQLQQFCQEMWRGANPLAANVGHMQGGAGGANPGPVYDDQQQQYYNVNQQ